MWFTVSVGVGGRELRVAFGSCVQRLKAGSLGARGPWSLPSLVTVRCGLCGSGGKKTELGGEKNPGEKNPVL